MGLNWRQGGQNLAYSIGDMAKMYMAQQQQQQALEQQRAFDEAQWLEHQKVIEASRVAAGERGLANAQARDASQFDLRNVLVGEGFENDPYNQPAPMPMQQGPGLAGQSTGGPMRQFQGPPEPTLADMAGVPVSNADALAYAMRQPVVPEVEEPGNVVTVPQGDRHKVGGAEELDYSAATLNALYPKETGSGDNEKKPVSRQAFLRGLFNEKAVGYWDKETAEYINAVDVETGDFSGGQNLNRVRSMGLLEEYAAFAEQAFTETEDPTFAADAAYAYVNEQIPLREALLKAEQYSNPDNYKIEDGKVKRHVDRDASKGNWFGMWGWEEVDTLTSLRSALLASDGTVAWPEVREALADLGYDETLLKDILAKDPDSPVAKSKVSSAANLTD